MYSSFQLTKKFLHYYFTAKSGKGHGIHSPFVFDFIINVLNDKKKYGCYDAIEARRKELLNDPAVIEVEDFGTGSAIVPSNKKKVSAIAASSLKNKKFGQLLFRTVKYYQPETIVELGTSLGITTSYLACANPRSTVFTLEGSKAVAAIAKSNFERLNLANIYLTQGHFEKAIPTIYPTIKKIDLIFVDGNHRKEATLKYFSESLKKSTPSSIFIFDDIHWSPGMEEAWTEIKANSSVTLTIDLFFVGFVFFNPAFKEKQDFVIRY